MTIPKTVRKPEWTAEAWRENRRLMRYSQYQNGTGQVWAFLFDLEKDKLLLSGGDISWEVRSRPGKEVVNFHKWDAMEQVTTASMRFNLLMDLDERLWLAACIRMASEARETYKISLEDSDIAKGIAKGGAKP